MKRMIFPYQRKRREKGEEKRSFKAKPYTKILSIFLLLLLVIFFE
jgi:hypothetical protein